MRVVLLGGGGFISSAVECRLIGDGHDVVVLNRSGRTARPKTQAVRGDCTDPVALRSLAAAGCDAVVDFRCFDARDARRTVEAFRGVAHTGLMISTGSVYWCTGIWSNPVGEDQYDRDEVSERPPTGLTPGSIEYSYGLGKRQAEEVFAEAAEQGQLRSVRLRFPIVMGPGDPTGRYAGYVHRVREGGQILVPDGGYNSFRHVFVEDAAAAVVAALTREPAAGGYNVCSPTIASVRDVLAALASALNRPEPEVVAVPAELLAAWGVERPFAPFSSQRDQVLDPSRGLRELGLEPTPWAEALARTVPAVAGDGPGTYGAEATGPDEEAAIISRLRALLR